MAKGTAFLASSIRKSRSNFPRVLETGSLTTLPLVLANYSCCRERNSIERGLGGGGRGGEMGEQKERGCGVKSTLAWLRVCVTFKPLAVQVDFYLNEVSTGIDPSLSLPL